MSAHKISCPTCSHETVWSQSNPFRPFCSERCRLIDLGEWLAEKHVIPGNDGDAVSQDPDDYK